MHLGPTLLRRDSPCNEEAREPRLARIGRQQAWRLKAEDFHSVEPSSSCDGRNTDSEQHPNSNLNPHTSRPLAQIGERFPPEPVARSIDSAKMSNSAPSVNPPLASSTNPSSPHPQTPRSLPPDEPRKLVASIPEELLAQLRSKCSEKASVSLLGRLQGKHPGLRALTAWARETLHPSLVLLSLKTNNVFEVTFEHPEGRLHALNQADLTCESATIFFSSWRPHFDSRNPHAADKLDHPVWVQIVDLCQVLREEAFLQTIGAQIGQVISIDNSEAYKAKLFGPRIRLLVRDLDNLPHTVVIPRLDGAGTVEYALEFSGLPHQCGRCRSRDHQVRNCPKKENQRRRDLRPQPPQVKHPPPPTPNLPNPPPKTSEHVATSDTPIKLSSEMEGGAAGSPRKENSPPHGTLFTPALAQPVQPPPDHTVVPEVSEPSETSGNNNSPLQPDDHNFPKLPSPRTGSRDNGSQQGRQPLNVETPSTPHFVWRPQPSSLDDHTQQTTSGEDKGKAILSTPPTTDSAPLTRQGYRTGRLADDFWSTIQVPNMPITTRKKLQVIPFLIKTQRESVEYLVDNKTLSYKPITQVHIGEVLAGIPWTEHRVKQHVVNEVAQALHKIFVFNNKVPNPLQKWKHGRWFAKWEEQKEGEFTCTLYVSIKVQEAQLKPRRGQNLGWRQVSLPIWERISTHLSDSIADCTEEAQQWQQMVAKHTHPGSKIAQQSGSKPPNRFSALLEEDILNPESAHDR